MAEITKVERKTPGAIKGVVVSDKMDKTCVIEVKRQTTHPLYHKRVWKRNRFKVHDEKNESRLGDTILAIKCRPLSKEKALRLKEIVHKGVQG